MRSLLPVRSTDVAFAFAPSWGVATSTTSSHVKHPHQRRARLDRAALSRGCFVVLLSLLWCGASFAQAPDESDGAPDEASGAKGDGASSGEGDSAPDPDANPGEANDVPEAAGATDPNLADYEVMGGEKSESKPESPFGLPPGVFGALVTGGVTAATFFGAALLGGLPAVAILVNYHTNSKALDPWVGVMVAAPIFVVTGFGTTIAGAFVLDKSGAMAAGLSGVGAGLVGSAIAAGAMVGIAYAVTGRLPIGPEIEPYAWGAGLAGITLGGVAATAAAAGIGYTFASDRSVGAAE